MCRACTGATPGLSEPQQISPEAVGVLGRRLDVTQATWSSPITDRLLIEAGYGGTYFGVGNFERDPNPTRDLVRVVEQCASGCAANGGIPGLAYRSQDFSVAHTGSYLWKGSVSYVTGTPQPEGGVSAHAHDRRPHVDDERSVAHVPGGQRRAESAHAVDFAVGERRARGVAGVVRAGAVDRAPADAARRRARRSRLELVPGAAGRPFEISAGAAASFLKRAASTATRTSRHGSASRTTSPDEARRPSR